MSFRLLVVRQILPRAGLWPLGIVLLLLAAVTAAAADPAPPPAAAPAIISARANAASVPLYGLFELRVRLTATFDNPFDPDQIALAADFTGPTGKTVHVDGFYCPAAATDTAASGADWLIRFAPTQTGPWRYTITATNHAGSDNRGGEFTATPSANPGYVRVSRRDPSRFQFDNGRPYFPIGEDMCWGQHGTLDGYDTWLPKLQDAGGNWIRIWMCSWSNGIEWSSGGGYGGLGRYNLANAAQLDTLLDKCDTHGLHVMLTLGTYNEFTTGGFFHEGQWAKSPYNAANGGPCATPADYWSSPIAMKFYRQRLRYIFARYGWRTGIESWELWNEANAPADWIRAMAQYIKGTGPYAGQPPADPFGHLLTTTYGSDEIWKIPEIDWTQTHFYGDSGNVEDFAAKIVDDSHQFTQYGKPHQMSEFGIDWRKPDAPYDPDGKGVNMHDGIWAAALSGDAGSAMIWWWDNYVDPKNLYGQFAPLAKLMADANTSDSTWRPMAFGPVTATGGVETFGDAVLPAATGWGKAPVSEFTIAADGSSGSQVYPGYLYSPSKPDLRTLPLFHVDYPMPGQFIVHVDTISNLAELDFVIDGVVTRTVAFNAAPPTDPAVKPEYKSTKLEPQWKVYQAKFDNDYAVDVPAGKHTVGLVNPRGDWISVTEYRLTNYRSSRYPPVRVVGVTNGTASLIWAQNALYNWKSVYEDRAIPPINGADINVEGMTPGTYTVAEIDTQTGARTAAGKATTTPGVHELKVSLPELSTDCAIELTRLP